MADSTFQHHCYTDQEAEAERIRRETPSTPHKGIPGMLLRVAGTVAYFVFQVLLVIFFIHWWKLGHTVDALSSMILEVRNTGHGKGWAIGACLVFLIYHYGTQYGHCESVAGLRPLDLRELESMATWADMTWETKDQVKSWLADGKTLRVRDLNAVQDFSMDLRAAEEAASRAKGKQEREAQDAKRLDDVMYRLRGDRSEQTTSLNQELDR
jgi:hypothetical protein